MKNKEVSERLQKVMEKKELSIKKISLDMKTPIANVSRYVNGDRVPSNDWLFKFHRIYHVDIMWLLYGETKKVVIENFQADLNIFFGSIPSKELYDYIIHYDESKQIFEYRKRFGISYKQMRGFAKEWFGQRQGIY